MAYTAQQALDLLASDPNKSVAQIIELVKDVSGAVTAASGGSTHLLYTGSMPDGTKSAEIASAIKKEGLPGVFDLISSEVGTFVDDPAFRRALGNAITQDVLNGAPGPATPAQTQEIKRRMFEIYDGKLPDGVTRINSTSIWDIASAKYVSEAEGNFRIIAPKPHDLSVFVQSELPALLKNSKVSTIDGLPLADLQALEKSHGLDAVKKVIAYNSFTQIVHTGLSTSNVDDYLKVTPEKLSDLASDATKLKAVQDNLGMLKPEERAALKAADDIIHDVSKTSSGFSRFFKKALGPAGVLLGLGLAAYDAGAAESRGDHEAAKEIMTRWAVDAAGSELAMLAAGAVAGIGTAALVAASVISAPVAAAIVVGAIFLGGFFGGDGALELYELTKDLDHNDHMDLLDKLGNLVFGANYTITSPLPADLNGERLTLDTTFSREEIVSNAKDNIAWRYALRELNPFVIPDISYDQHKNQRGQRHLAL